MFHVPEKNRASQLPGWESKRGDDFGAFVFKKANIHVTVIATAGSDEIPWEHVSVSIKDKKFRQLHRCPTWEEMATIKSLFWDPEDVVVQFHPPESQYVSYHHYTLHLWRKHNIDFETPPTIAIAPEVEGQELKG